MEVLQCSSNYFLCRLMIPAVIMFYLFKTGARGGAVREDLRGRRRVRQYKMVEVV